MGSPPCSTFQSPPASCQVAETLAGRGLGSRAQEQRSRGGQEMRSNKAYEQRSNVTYDQKAVKPRRQKADRQQIKGVEKYRNIGAGQQLSRGVNNERAEE